MKFTVEGKSLADTISALRKVLPSIQYVNLVAHGSSLNALANDGVGIVSIKIANCSIDVPGSVTCPLDALLGSVKGRKTVEFDLVKGSLTFTDTKQYKGKFDLPPYTEIEIDLPKDDQAFEVSESAAAEFEQTINLALLQGSFDSKAEVPLYLRAGPKGTEAMCYDEYYVVRVKNTKATFAEKFIVGMPPTALLNAIQLGGKTKYRLMLTPDSLWAYNKQFVMRQPLLQLDNASDSFSNIGSVVDDFLDAISCSATIDTQRLTDVLANFDNFYVRGAAVGFKISKRGIEVALDSNVGSVSERIEGTTEGAGATVYQCELQLVKELLQKVTSPEVCLQFVDGRALIIQQDDGAKALFMSAGLTSSDN